MSTRPEINVYEVDVSELQRIAVGPLTQPPGTWKRLLNNLAAEIADERVTMLGAYQLIGENEVPVGLCAMRIFDTPPGRDNDPNNVISDRVAGALIRLARQERDNDPAIGLTVLEECTPGVAAAANFAALLVAPTARRQGVGIKLHQYRNELLARKFPGRPLPVFLRVAAYNEAAQGLDEKQGFKLLTEADGSPLTVVGETTHYPAIDDHGNYPPGKENVVFNYMGRLLVPDHLTRDR